MCLVYDESYKNYNDDDSFKMWVLYFSLREKRIKTTYKKELGPKQSIKCDSQIPKCKNKSKVNTLTLL
jgi:hypothetical protein